MCTVLLPPGVNPIAVNKYIMRKLSERIMLKVKMRKLKISAQLLKVRTGQLTVKIMSTFRKTQLSESLKMNFQLPAFGQ
jgi:hypothetical protein